MRFKSSIKSVNTFVKLTASLNLLGKVAWVRLDNDSIRFTVVPEQGTQVWAVISIDSIFGEDYHIESAAPNNTINLEVPLASLHGALRSAQNALAASIRLTKKDNVPLLSLTVHVQLPSGGSGSSSSGGGGGGIGGMGMGTGYGTGYGTGESTVSQDVCVRVLSAAVVDGIHEPHCSEPEVHILLPPLAQLRAVSERFTKLALASSSSSTSGSSSSRLLGSSAAGPKLELAANMHGQLRLALRTDALAVRTCWSGLANPDLDPGQVEGGEEGVRRHPSTAWKAREGDEGWAVVRVEGRDWGRVLGVGRLGGRVVACFCHDRALILYVYLPNEGLGAVAGSEESVLTYYVSSYLA